MRHRIFVLCDWDPLFWGKIRSSVYYFWEPLFFFFVIVTESKTFWVVNFLCWEPCWTCFPIGLLIRLNLIPDVYTKNYWTIAQYLTISARLFLVNFFFKARTFRKLPKLRRNELHLYKTPLKECRQESVWPNVQLLVQKWWFFVKTASIIQVYFICSCNQIVPLFQWFSF